MSLTVKGKVHEIGTVQNISDTFKKRELILEYAENPQYPEFIKFEAINDKTDIFNYVKVGEQAEISFNLRGRKWTDRNGKDSFFNTLLAWKVSKLEGTGSPVQEVASPVDISNPGDEDDLPF